MMKKYLLAAALVVCLGCEVETSSKESRSSALWQYDSVVIDSCEYLYRETNSTLIHKNNCKNCRKFFTELLKGAKP